MSKSRYSKFITDNGQILKVPFIKIPVRSSDYYETYKNGITRMDLLSYKYYGDPNYGWLIMQANPQFNGLEFTIPNKSMIRIPFPLDSALKQYELDIDLYKEINGFEKMSD